MTLKQESCLAKFFKSLLNVIKKDKKEKVSRETNKKVKKTEKKKNNKIKPPIKKNNNSNIQMPAPWSRVEKYKRIKKDYPY